MTSATRASGSTFLVIGERTNITGSPKFAKAIKAGDWEAVGIPIGVYSAVVQDTVGDYIARSFAIIALALPGFWVGTLVMVFPAIWWGW
ncbi:MAG: hypothetical protein ACKPB0_06835, partial [Opitutaceae bacterium]